MQLYTYINICIMKRKLLIISGIFQCIISLNAQVLKNVNADQFHSLSENSKGIILDVRTPAEYSRGHIKNSTLISTNDPKFLEKVGLLQKDKDIYVYCLTGSRSRAVANYLSQKGFKHVYNLSRGILEWQGSGYPIVKDENPIASVGQSYNNDEFNKLLKTNQVVLVDFHAVWCAPCKKMSPTIDRIMKEYAEKVKVEKIDVEANKQLQTNYGIQSVPGLIIFKNGTEVWRHAGIMEYDNLTKILNQYL